MDETHIIVKQSLVVTLAAIIAIAAVFGIYYWYDREGPAATPATAPAVAAAPVAPAAPAAPSPPADDPAVDHATPLDASDGKVVEALSGISGWSASLLHLLLTKDLVRHVVATVDALPRDKLPVAAVPLRSVPGAFSVVTQGTHSTIAAANARRYDPYVKAVGALDMRGVAAVYRHFYPQFQQAYRELGYPKGDFNERLIEVIDDLLEAPEPKTPLEVVAPGVMYHFVDPDLEALPAGQKILVRVGPDSEGTLKGLLRQFRQAVAR